MSPLEEEETEEEGLKPTPVWQPIQPTKREIQEHELTHIPYRSWCIHCVKARGRSDQHRANTREEDEEKETGTVTTWSMDYCFITEEAETEEERPGDDDRIKDTIMVCHDRRTGGVQAYLVNCKGNGDPWIADRITKDMENYGYGAADVRVKCDQEPAIVDVQRAVIEKRKGARTIPVNSPVGDSMSNGRVENAIRRFQGMLRAIKHDLEGHLGVKIGRNHPLFPWMIQWAGDVITRYGLNNAGRTPTREIRGKESAKPIVKFGERILYMPLKLSSHPVGKVDDRFLDGIFVGMRMRSDEILVATEHGVVKTRTIRRRPEEEQWDRDFAGRVKGSPRQPDPNIQSDYVSSAISKRRVEEDHGVPRVIGQPDDEEVPREVNRPAEEPSMRKMYVKKKDVEKYGRTPGCPGCSGRGTHNDKCRETIKKAMEQDEQGRDRLRQELDRTDRHFERAVQKQIETDPVLKEEVGQHEAEVEASRKRHLEGGEVGAPEKSQRAEEAASSSGIARPEKRGGEEILEERPAKRIIPEALSQPQGSTDDHSLPRVPRDPQPGGTDMPVMAEVDVEPSQQSDMIIEYLGHCQANAVEVYSAQGATSAVDGDSQGVTWISMDITAADADGEQWDFNDEKMRNRAMRRILEDRPYLLVGGPLHLKENPGKKSELRQKAMVHMEFMCKLYKLQHESGRYFLHTHPERAILIKEEYIQRIRALASIDALRVNPGRGSQSTRTLLTNCPALAHVMRHRGEQGQRPQGAMVEEGIRLQQAWEHRGEKLIAQIEEDADRDSMAVPPEEKEDETWCAEAWDDVSGKELDPAKVLMARREEMEYYKKMDVYEKVPLEECYQMTGKTPLKARWIDIDKGTRYRSRWVAKQFKGSDAEEWFAATPPIEALRAIVSSAVTGNVGKAISVMDVSRAFFYAPVQHRIYVELCEEAIECEEDRGKCARLKMSMYGTKAAAQNWQREVQNTMRSLGFKMGKSSSVVFYHPKKDIKTLVHGDDFVSSGRPEDLAWLRTQMETKYEITTTVLGPHDGMKREVKVLNRMLRWHEQGISYEADERHAREIIKQTGADRLPPLKVPISKEDNAETDGEKGKDIRERKARGELGKRREVDAARILDSQESTRYRAIAARANYLAIDRGDIMFATKELTRKMSEPTEHDWNKLVRLGRYLAGRPRVLLWYKHQQEPTCVEGHSDTDWAGCKRTRRSTTGGYLSYGSHVLKMWCKTQATVALSSAEAELYGIVRAAAEVLGAKSLLRDLGQDIGGCVLGDASAALAIVQRQGLGKLRHLDTHYLWVQEKAVRKELDFKKVQGKNNAADLFTKAVRWEDIKKHMDKMDEEFKGENMVFDGAKADEVLKVTVANLMEEIKREGETNELKVWRRYDLGTRTAKTTLRGGPSWSQVVARVAVDDGTGQILLRERARDIRRDAEHRLLVGDAKTVATALIYRP